MVGTWPEWVNMLYLRSSQRNDSLLSKQAAQVQPHWKVMIEVLSGFTKDLVIVPKVLAAYQFPIEQKLRLPWTDCW